MNYEYSQKRRKTVHTNSEVDVSGVRVSTVQPSLSTVVSNVATTNTTNVSSSLRRSISPPARRRNCTIASFGTGVSISPPNDLNKPSHLRQNPTTEHKSPRSLPSPVQLSNVESLSPSDNIDTVSLKAILNDPLIKECWVFNYLFDVNFLMSNFDEDVRDLVQVKIVHGSWKAEDSNKIRIDDAVKRFSNVKAFTAYMPEAFGTHHSKMIILFRHDDQAQVIIFTANIVAGDWRMCQAVWRSPLLPLQDETLEGFDAENRSLAIGSGEVFKKDLLAYLHTYGQLKLSGLTTQLEKFDFSNIRAALVASTPGRQNMRSCVSNTETIWGWPGLKRILSNIPVKPGTARPHIVVQVSSVASLGAGNKWLDGTLLDTLATTRPTKSKTNPKPRFSLVFPTAEEIRRSLDGYGSGGSIHMKTQSTAQANQLARLRPMLCYWAGDGSPSAASTSTMASSDVREAGRRRAAPHIKTYIRFNDESMQRIDWAMMTSANLSTQAWGAATNSGGEVRICSYEIGVVVWPALWDENDEDHAEMVPAFKKDLPSSKHNAANDGDDSNQKTTVGWRMPYDLPLVPYLSDEMPWCAAAPDKEPDWMGRTWPGFGSD